MILIYGKIKTSASCATGNVEIRHKKNTKLTIALLLVSVAIDFLQTNKLENV